MSGNKNFLFTDYQQDSDHNDYETYNKKTDRK